MTTLRRFNCRDLFSFNTVNLDYFTETYNLSFYLQYLARWPEYCQMAVAPNHNNMAYILGKAEGEKRNWHGHVTAVTVAPPYRRQGLAQKLMNLLEDVTINRHNAYFVDLFVRVSNTAAIEMYKTFGYSVYRTVLGYYSNKEDAYDMRKAMPRDKDKRSIIPLGRPKSFTVPQKGAFYLHYKAQKNVKTSSSKRISLQKPLAAADAQSTASQSSKNTEEYLSWANQAGIIFPKVTQAFFGELRGSKALESIEPEERFVTVPRTAALVVEPTARCPCSDFTSPAFWKQAPWFIKMAVLLLKEASLGKQSPVWGYIIQLPDTIDTPVRWSAEEIAELQYAPLEQGIKQQQKLWKEQFDKFKQESSSLNGSNVTWERFVWAAENVRSRAFSGPYAGSPLSERLKIGGFVAAAGLAYVTFAHVPLEQALNGAIAAAVFNLLYDIVLSNKLKWYALCPVIDAINHSSKVESTIEYEYFKDTFVASSNTAYKPGDQVYISYGAQPNSALLQYYGFVEKGNKNDVYALNGVINGKDVELIIVANGNLTKESIQAAKEAARNLDDKEFRRQILESIEAELERKPTSLADDERALAASHLLTDRKRAALEFRADKKKLLNQGIKRWSKRVAATEQTMK